MQFQSIIENSGQFQKKKLKTHKSTYSIFRRQGFSIEFLNFDTELKNYEDVADIGFGEVDRDGFLADLENLEHDIFQHIENEDFQMWPSFKRVITRGPKSQGLRTTFFYKIIEFCCFNIEKQEQMW